MTLKERPNWRKIRPVFYAQMHLKKAEKDVIASQCAHWSAMTPLLRFFRANHACSRKVISPVSSFMPSTMARDSSR